MELNKEELKIIKNALSTYGGCEELLEAVELEIEKMELEEFSFDEDDGCAGGACKL